MNAPRRAALLAGCAGLGLLAVAFLPWFEVGTTRVFDSTGSSRVVSVYSDLWEAFGFVDVVVAIAVACAVSTAFFALRGDASGIPVAGSSVTAGVGLLATVLIGLKLIDPPPSAGVEPGAWLGLAAAAAVAFASWRGMGSGEPRSDA